MRMNRVIWTVLRGWTGLFLELEFVYFIGVLPNPNTKLFLWKYKIFICILNSPNLVLFIDKFEEIILWDGLDNLLEPLDV